ncbi:small acid-soluble spore protein [Bacillus sp. OxB-1]|uniref:gamma-type small acid-soluble spore protein n=1 Tax=Bacillus sp. (strain OxB-1) TaxID=98228 RepID=UPI000581E24C|nr:gamma-type small acid-soluble spore protein [Bacillus sp. OxB-1]BAQ08716.1 small acid-soluble spore protein [Bacillus sp. OxB-1]
MTKKPNFTDAQQVRKQNQLSAQPNAMKEEFASETDVNQVRQQNQQSEANKQKASGNASQFGTK